MSEGSGYTLRDVEIFAAGEHRGEPYSPADLDDVVRNFDLFSSPRARKVFLRVPGVRGHEEDGERQKYLERTDQPADGWVTALKRSKDGKTLLADFDHVTPAFAEMLRGKRYRTVSAELYPRPPAGFPPEARGKVLRRVAFLGAEIPQVKGLAEVPDPVPHSERPAARRTLRAGPCYHDVRHGFVACFSEVSEVRPVDDRQQMLDALAKHGVDTSVITDAVPDPVLAEMVRCLDAKGRDDDDQPPPSPMEMDEEGWKDPADDDERMKYRECARKYLERARKYAAKYGEGMDDDDDEDEKRKKREAAGAAALAAGSAMKMSEADLKRLIRETIQSEAGGAVRELKRFSEENLTAEKARTVDAVVERLSAAGKLPPAVRADFRQRLLDADARTVVRKFSEGGKKVELTAFDLAVREQEKYPSLFGERLPGAPLGAESEDAEVAKVEAHYEAFSESFAQVDTSKQELVSAFKAKRKREPRLTAEAFLNAGGRK